MGAEQIQEQIKNEMFIAAHKKSNRTPNLTKMYAYKRLVIQLCVRKCSMRFCSCFMTASQPACVGCTLSQ